MATPTASQPVSTPKHLLNTPRHLASPRPGTATSSHRPSAGKSPAVKTPASLQGHGHQVSGFSQPGSTPAAAGGIHEDILGIKSPEAIGLAALNTTGLTPLPGAQDGLGISAAMNGSGLPVVRNPEAERVHNLRRVVDILGAHTVGRGITRDGVEKIAQAQGYTTLWDRDTLTIAGNKVDLEILFDRATTEKVKDVVLRLNVLDVEDPQLQKEASAVLRQSLVEDGRATGLREPWMGMHEFSENLKRLSELDHINTSTNCFDLIAGVSTALRRIWDAEKQRLTWRNDLHHLCHGNVGRPSFNETSIGLRLRYWCSRTQIPNQGNREVDSHWAGAISCATGQPFVTKPPQWLSSDILSSVEIDEQPTANTSIVPNPTWSSIHADLGDTEHDSMNIDKSDMLDVRFVFKLDRPVHLPLGTAATLNAEIPMLELDQSKALTYQHAIQHRREVGHVLQNPQSSVAQRWTRAVDAFDSTGQHSTSSHSYCLYSIPPDAPLWCYPVRELRFSHPRQLVEALPLLRQYAMVWDLMTNLVPENPTMTPLHTVGNEHNQAHSTEKNGKTVKRSNRKSEQTKLQALLASSNDNRSTLLVDLSLDVVSDPSKVKIKVFVVVPGDGLMQHHASFLRIEIGVGLNGTISVDSLSRAAFPDVDEWRVKFEKRLQLFGDIGTVLEWLLQKIPRIATSKVVQP